MDVNTANGNQATEDLKQDEIVRENDSLNEIDDEKDFGATKKDEINGNVEQSQEDSTIEDDDKKQSSRKNALFKRQRELEKAQKDFYIKGLIDAVNGVNPYTSEKIETQADIDIYLSMREAEKRGYDNPRDDFYKIRKEEILKESQTKESEEKAEEFQKKDINDFDTKYPDIRTDLMKDDLFIDTYGDKIGSVPLTELYEKYQNILTRVEKKVQEVEDNKKIKVLAKQQSAVGEVAKTKVVANYDVNNMSTAEFDEFYAKVLRGELSKK